MAIVLGQMVVAAEAALGRATALLDGRDLMIRAGT
jgi:hypothetical protein